MTTHSSRLYYRRVRGLLLFVLVMGFVTSMAFSQGSTELVAANREPSTIDPHVGADAGTWRVGINVYESLLGFDPESLELIGVLATDWEVSEDGLSYIFQLREGVIFHDGAPFDAEAVAASFNRLKTIGLGPAYVLDNYVGADVLDSHRVRINISQPMPTFLSMLPRVFIVSPIAVREHEIDGDLAQGWFRENASGTGPYIFKEWIPGQEWVLVKNEDYWQGWPERHITQVTLRFVQEASTQRLMLERGELDIANLYSTDSLDQLRANPNIEVLVTPSLNQLYIGMNTAAGPLSDERVRRAVSHAFDYESHIEFGLAGLGTIPAGPVPSVIPMHNGEVSRYEYDLELARELLREAGYPDGNFAVTFSFVQGLAEQLRAGQILQSGLAQLGITLELNPLTWPTLLGQIQSGPSESPDMFALYIYPGYPDPDAFLFQQYHSSQSGPGNNGMHYSNSVIDDLLERGRATTNPAVRAEIYAEAQAIIASDAPSIFVSNPSFVLPMRSWVKGFKYNPAFSESYYFYGVHLDGKPIN